MNKHTSAAVRELPESENLLIKSLVRSMVVRGGLLILLSTVVLSLLLVLGTNLYYLRSYAEWSPIYQIAQLVKTVAPYCLILVWFVIVIAVMFYYLKKTVGYIDLIVEASKQLVVDAELISLPSELYQIEVQMNQIKQQAFRSTNLAREAEQRKNDLIVYLAHDLKTPLTSVIGYLTLLRDEGQISEQLRVKYLSIALDKAERLEDLINEFFEITRFNLSELTLEISRVNLSLMLEQLVYEFKPLFLTKNLTCQLQIAPNLEIRCDVGKLERVFDNLIRNAVNYSFEDSVIEITGVQSAGGVLLDFVNYGNPIGQDKLARIFEQFYRLDSARTSTNGGAGLGLAISKEIVELHGGTICAVSGGEKVEFEVFLPNL